MLYMKKCQSLNKMTKKILLDGCSPTLEIFLVKHIKFLFYLANNIFRNLTKNALTYFKLEKSLKYFFFSCSKYDFLIRNCYNSFSTNDLFAEITFPCLL